MLNRRLIESWNATRRAFGGTITILSGRAAQHPGVLSARGSPRGAYDSRAKGGVARRDAVMLASAGRVRQAYNRRSAASPAGRPIKNKARTAGKREGARC
jgi:hypothetical protein